MPTSYISEIYILNYRNEFPDASSLLPGNRSKSPFVNKVRFKDLAMSCPFIFPSRQSSLGLVKSDKSSLFGNNTQHLESFVQEAGVDNKFFLYFGRDFTFILT